MISETAGLSKKYLRGGSGCDFENLMGLLEDIKWHIMIFLK